MIGFEEAFGTTKDLDAPQHLLSSSSDIHHPLYLSSPPGLFFGYDYDYARQRHLFLTAFSLSGLYLFVIYISQHQSRTQT
jgi:hypothetical protein